MQTTATPQANWTRHARTRLQQRGISQDSAKMLLDWGYYEPISDGVIRVFFRKCDLKRLCEKLPKPQWLTIESRKQIYAVVSADDTVITIGHRDRHMVRR